MVVVILTVQNDGPAGRHLRVLVDIQVIKFEVEATVHACDGDSLSIRQVEDIRCHCDLSAPRENLGGLKDYHAYYMSWDTFLQLPCNGDSALVYPYRAPNLQ